MKTQKFAIFDREGNRLSQFPIYHDMMTGEHAVERIIDRHPDLWGAYLDEIN